MRTGITSEDYAVMAKGQKAQNFYDAVYGFNHPLQKRAKVGDHSESLRDITPTKEERRLVEDRKSGGPDNEEIKALIQERDRLAEMIAHPGEGQDLYSMAVRKAALDREIEIKRVFQAPHLTDRAGHVQ